ncbi:MAG: acetolactate synthase small subunit [Nitrospirae bacterium]|nr:acetolactate synthase small subunit [Nitrospirota bacterium]
MERIISLLVENKFGVLVRVAGLFSARGFNIESLSVGPTIDPSMSLITIVTEGDERILEQITKQLNKLIDVIKVVDLTENDFVERETTLVKIHTRTEDRAEAFRIIEIFRAKIVDSTPTTYTVEITGDAQKVEAFINQLRPLGLKELVRSGRIAIARDDAKAAGDHKRRQVVVEAK